MRKNQQGYTLIELLVVMVVFIVVIIIAGDAFKAVLTQSSKLFRSEESNIEGIVGLEMMRHDLQQAGYGLYTEPLVTPYTGEATVSPASTFNEPDFASPPRAIVTGDNIPIGTQDTGSESGNSYTLAQGADYLAIKATSASRDSAAQKWTYLTHVPGSTETPPNIWPSQVENLATNDKVVLLQRKLSLATNSLTLVPDSSNDFYFSYSNVAFNNYSTNSRNYIIYGLDGGGTIRMPFNRTDYFVARPSTANRMPTVCAPNVGELYKAVINQSDGKLTYYPVLDCVADMQVVLGWDLRNGSSPGTDGLIDTWSNAGGSVVAQNNTAGFATAAEVQAALADPVKIRTCLKVIKVYVLAQNGRKDPSYVSPSPITVGDVGEASLTRSYDVTANGGSNYRWKLYRIIVRPKNLQSNQ